MMGLVEGRARGGNGEGSCCTITTASPFHTWVELAICCCSCFPTSLPHPPLERLFKCFLRRRHARPLVSESSRSVSTSATAVLRLSKVCCPFEPLIWPQKPTKKTNRSSHGHKTNYYMPDVSFCLFRKCFPSLQDVKFQCRSRRFQVSWSFISLLFNLFSIFSLFHHNKLSCPAIRFHKTSHQSHKWQQKQQQRKRSRHQQSLHVSFISLILAVRCFIRVLTTDLLRCK